MSTDFEEKRKKAYAGRRSIMDIGMGLLIGGLGVFIAFSDKFGMKIDLEPQFKYAFAGLCVLYGGFRVYRGFQKNYFKE